jgi:hypothetical protein
MGAKDSTGSDLTAFVRSTLDEGVAVGHIAIADGGNEKRLCVDCTRLCVDCTCSQLLLVEHRPLY